MYICEACTFFSMESASESEPLTELVTGKIYRLKPGHNGLGYEQAYKQGRYMDVRVIAGPNAIENYLVDTRDAHGAFIGTAGGWAGDSDRWIPAHYCEELF
jgi:hypothetical protein